MSDRAVVRVVATGKIQLDGEGGPLPSEDEVFAVAEELSSAIGMKLASLGDCTSGELSIEITDGDRGVKGTLSQEGQLEWSVSGNFAEPHPLDRGDESLRWPTL